VFLLQEVSTRHSAEQVVYSLSADLALAVALTRGLTTTTTTTAGSGVVVLDIGDLSSIGATEQSYSLAVLNNSGQKLAFVVVAHLLHVLEASQVRCGLGP
jgi:hypothetical protein